MRSNLFNEYYSVLGDAKNSIKILKRYHNNHLTQKESNSPRQHDPQSGS